MDERLILESIERYIRGEMLPEERKFFEELRKSNPGLIRWLLNIQFSCT